ncbi:MAG: PadR family transcriptional regulator [Acidilobus sp.]
MFKLIQEDEEKMANEAFRTRAMSRLLKNITIRTLWLYVLAVLKEGPTYPYNVKKGIREKFSFNPPTVTLYTVMYRLEREGLIKKTEKGTYEVTEVGLQALKEGARLLSELSHKIIDMSS